MTERDVKREEYKGHNIRSHPFEVERKKKNGWEVRIDIINPFVHGTTSGREYLDETQLYSTLGEALTTGIEYGRRIIDEQIKEQSRPFPLA